MTRNRFMALLGPLALILPLASTVEAFLVVDSTGRVLGNLEQSFTAFGDRVSALRDAGHPLTVTIPRDVALSGRGNCNS